MAVIEIHGPDAVAEELLVAVGDELVVRLVEQAGSTGYQWSVAAVPEPLDADGDVVVRAGSSGPPGGPGPGPGGGQQGDGLGAEPVEAPVGAAGEHVFAFRATRPGSGVLRLTLARVWEGEPVQVVELQVDVAP